MVATARPAAPLPLVRATSRLSDQQWRFVPALLVTCSSLLFSFGAAWDIQWHPSIGRDSVFIPPHDLMLVGIALSGLTALTTILAVSFFQRERHANATPLLVGRHAAF